VAAVDQRIVDEIERKILGSNARQFVVESALKAMHQGVERSAVTTTELRTAISRVEVEIENLLRVIEAGNAPASVVERVRDRERERASLQTQLAETKERRAFSELDARRMRRVLEDGLSRIGDVLRSDVATSRQALAKLFADKVRFTPVQLASGDRTYSFEGNLTLGQIASLTPQNGVNVPDGIRTRL
jgi:chromosome segregation ATPase